MSGLRRDGVTGPRAGRQFRWRPGVGIAAVIALLGGCAAAALLSRGGEAAASIGVASPGEQLTAGQAPITSPNGDYRLFLTHGGQLAEQSVYGVMPITVTTYPDGTSFSAGGNAAGGIQGPPDAVQIWRSRAAAGPGARAVMQADGNLVIYGAGGQAAWSTGTGGHPGAHLALQDDANIVIYDSRGRALWASNTVSIVHADGASGGNLRGCPWPEAPAGDYRCTGPTLANGTSATMLCWLSTPTPPSYGNYASDKWFYVRAAGGPNTGVSGFIHSSLITAQSQIPTPGCIMSGKPAAASPPAAAPTLSGGSTQGGSTPGPGPGGSVRLAQGPPAPAGYRYAVSLSGFRPATSVRVTCYDSASPQGFYSFTLTTSASGSAFTDKECYSGDGPEHWVTANGVPSNKVPWAAAPAPATGTPPTTAPAALAKLDADATPAFGTCPSNPPPASEAYCGGWSNACHAAAFSKSACPTYVSQGTTVHPVCWATGQMINNSYSAVSPGARYTLESDIWIKVSDYPSDPWMNELWFNPDNTASGNLPHC